MDFTKYVALLESKSLYFSRADGFDDPFEGSVSLGTVEIRRVIYQNAPPEQRGDHTEEDFLRIFSSVFQRLRTLTFINCWHMNPGESVAMWSLYAPSGLGVAIRTTYAKLHKNTPPNVFLGLVQYKDYERSVIPDHNSFAPFVYKRHSFIHENEVRAVIQYDIKSTDPTPNGLSIPFPVTETIDAIYVSPQAPSWYLDLVEKVTRRYGFAIKVLQSQIDSAAIF